MQHLHFCFTALVSLYCTRTRDQLTQIVFCTFIRYSHSLLLDKVMVEVYKQVQTQKKCLFILCPIVMC